MRFLGNFSELIWRNVITPCDLRGLRDATNLFELLDFVAAGIEACKETLLFPMGKDTIVLTHEDCEYHCQFNGELTCFYSGSNNILGICNLNDFNNVFMAILYQYDNELEFDFDRNPVFYDETEENRYNFSLRLESFLKLQLQKSKSNAMAD